MTGLRLETARTRAGKLAAAAQSLKRHSGVAAPFSLAFLTDCRRIPHPEIIIRLLPRGAAVILRDYDMAGREALARRLKSICESRALFLLIGADEALARNAGADGVHLPSWRETAPENADGLIVTAACHNMAELSRAAGWGASLALLSPAFATPSHPGAPALGEDAFKDLAKASPLPVLALGGVDEANAPRLAGPNVAGLAAIGAFLARQSA